MVLVAAQAATPVPAPPEAHGLPPSAVDHVAVMEVTDNACGGCGRHWLTLKRSGRWAREERVYRDRREVDYSDFGSGTSFAIVRDREGIVVELSAERTLDMEDYRVLRREATGRYETVLGERCEIWRSSSRLLRLESCETADGVQLWIRHLASQPGEYLSSARAIWAERRPVRAAEVRPPTDFFQLAPWPKRPAGAETGYEVSLVSSTRGAQVRRGQGALTSRLHDPGDGTHHFWARDELGQFLYETDRTGRPARMRVQLWFKPPLGLPPPGNRWEAMPGRSPGTVLGEPCVWQEETSTRSTDAHYECRTADGIPLMIEDVWHWHNVPDHYTAQSRIRRPLTRADVAPPAEITDWRAWGVAPPT